MRHALALPAWRAVVFVTSRVTGQASAPAADRAAAFGDMGQLFGPVADGDPIDQPGLRQ